jgi:hypothetical protein
MYTISIDLPDLPKGTAIDVDGLGTFENGSTNDISEELAESFRMHHATIATQVDSNGSQQSSIVLGRTIEESFADNDNITVEKVVKAAAKPVAKEKVVVNNPEGSEN